MITFKQKNGKLNFEALGELNTTSIINLYGKWISLEPILGEFSDISNGLHGYWPGILYGKPNSILRECENSPGVWGFDFSNDISLLMFSDGFRKNNYKGTSYELLLDNNPTEANTVQALEFFLIDFAFRFRTNFNDDFLKLQSFKRNQIK